MNKLYITITIDTENSQSAIITGKWTKDTMISFCQGKNWGIRYIIKILEHYRVAATWYLSIFEKYIFGDKLMASVCDLLMKYNQDIQLHTHPVWFMDSEERKRMYMHQYSYDEQLYMISKGMEDIFKLIGRYPIAHRAGGYGVNRETFLAMNECGIKIDSSILYKNKDCKLQTSGIKNKITDFMGVTEIPVSIYKKSLNYPLLKWKNYNSINKIDINWMSSGEIIQVLKDVLNHGGGYINLFMHSGSFYKFYGGQGLNSIEDVVNRNDMAVNRFCKIIQYIKKKSNIEIVTVPVLYEKYFSGELFNSNYVPEVRRLKIK